MQPLDRHSYSVPVVLRVAAVVALVLVSAGALFAFLRVSLLGAWAVLGVGGLTAALGRIPTSITVSGDGVLSIRTGRAEERLHVTQVVGVDAPLPGSIRLRLPDGVVWSPVRHASALVADLRSLSEPLSR